MIKMRTAFIYHEVSLVSFGSIRLGGRTNGVWSWSHSTRSTYSRVNTERVDHGATSTRPSRGRYSTNGTSGRTCAVNETATREPWMNSRGQTQPCSDLFSTTALERRNFGPFSGTWTPWLTDWPSEPHICTLKRACQGTAQPKRACEDLFLGRTLNAIDP
jgi:hypothetical protein